MGVLGGVEAAFAVAAGAPRGRSGSGSGRRGGGGRRRSASRRGRGSIDFDGRKTFERSRRANATSPEPLSSPREREARGRGAGVGRQEEARARDDATHRGAEERKLRKREKHCASLSSLSPFTLFIRSTNSEFASHFFSSRLPFTLDTVRACRGWVLVFEKEKREGRARARTLSTLEVGAGLHKEIKYLSLPFCTLFLRKREHPSGLSRRQR